MHQKQRASHVQKHSGDFSQQEWDRTLVVNVSMTDVIHMEKLFKVRALKPRAGERRRSMPELGGAGHLTTTFRLEEESLVECGHP